MSVAVRVVSCPDPFSYSLSQERLWALLGGTGKSDGAVAYFLGQDIDENGADLAGRKVEDVVCRATAAGLAVTKEAVASALANYRRARGTMICWDNAGEDQTDREGRY